MVPQMLAAKPFYKIYLEQELARRCESNPRYSLRSFAKALEVDPGNLSRVFAGKASISKTTVEKVMRNLSMSTAEQTLFLNSFVEDKVLPGRDSLERFDSSLDAELFRVIGNWYHLALMELTFTKGCKPDPRWISSELGISPLEAKMAMDRLLALGLLEVRNGKLQKTREHTTTKNKDETTPALKKLQKELLEKAIFSLENTPIGEREQAAMTMAIDPKKLPLAKKMIQEFTNHVCHVLESGNRKRVYQLCVSLFPLQKSNK